MQPHRRNTLIGRLSDRRGYALVIVVLFNVLFLALLGVAWRRMASVIRVATIRTEQTLCDEGSLSVLAKSMRLLETGLPPSSPYERGAIVTLETSGEERFFRVKFERNDALLPEQHWSVTVTRTSVRPSDLLPAYFPTANP
jgi:hypothetical protein